MTSFCATTIRVSAKTSWVTRGRQSSGTGRKWWASSPGSVSSFCWPLPCSYWRRHVFSAANVTLGSRPTSRSTTTWIASVIVILSSKVIQFYSRFRSYFYCISIVIDFDLFLSFNCRMVFRLQSQTWNYLSLILFLLFCIRFRFMTIIVM